MRLRVLFSYSFHDRDHPWGVSGFRKIAEKSLQVVRQQLEENARGDLKIEPYFEEARTGEKLGEAVREAIFSCHVFVAEISARRPNVFYELGLAEATSRKIVLFQSANTSTPVPADVSDKSWRTYSNEVDFEEKLAEQILIRVRELIAETRTGSLLIAPKCMWFPQSVDSIYIVCSPEPKETMYQGNPVTDFSGIDRLEDRDALLAIHGYVCRAYPYSDVRVVSSQVVSDEVLSQNLIILGGPLRNSINERFSATVRSAVSYSSSYDRMHFPDGSEAQSTVDDSKNQYDCGFFGMYLNPRGTGSRVVMCHGAYTFGTLGAARLLTDRVTGIQNLQYIEKIADRDLSDITELEIGIRVPVFDRSEIRCPNLSDEVERVFLRLL